MSLLNKIGGLGNAWAAANVKSKAFDRVDTNDDRKLDQAELQATFDAMAARTGKTAPDAAAVIAKIDGDGDGALTRREIRAQVRELRAAPTSTLELAKRGGDSSAG